MKHTSMFLRLAAGAIVAGCTGASFAADISAIEPGSVNVALDGGKAVVRFTVSGTAAATDRCGYFVEYGDGMAGDSRVIDNANGRFSRQHERNFSAPGTYTIRASGRHVKTTPGCEGSASATVTVLAAAPARQAQAAPSCPEGWMLNEKSVNWRTGAFSCAPKPAGQLVCGDGLRYYERDGMIGCRQERRSEQRSSR